MCVTTNDQSEDYLNKIKINRINNYKGERDKYKSLDSPHSVSRWVTPF